MPIYEFYCEQCHTIYNFLSRSVNTEKIPLCPKCENVELHRKISLFAAISSRGDAEGDDEIPPMDEAKLEQAMGLLAREARHIDENDPREAAQLMRKLSDATGMSMGPAMEEALARMERGEDPEQIEADMGDLLESEEPFMEQVKKARQKGQRRAQPNVDETLYEL